MTTALLSYTGVSATGASCRRLNAMLINMGFISLVFARHILHGFSIEDTPFKQKAIALTMLTSAVASTGNCTPQTETVAYITLVACLFSNKWALRINSFSTVFKVGSLIL
jgi:hypothetical protein